jgi:hypothetical protein
MAHWEQMYPSIDFSSVQGYPNYFDTKWLNNSPIFLGLPTPHIVNFLEYLSKIELGGEDALIKLFILTMPSYLQDWLKGCCKDRGISSFIHLISRFIDFTKPHCQTYEDVLQSLMVALDDKGFTTEIIEDLRKSYHDQYQESSDIKGKVYEEHCQPLEEEQDLSHNSIEGSEDITRKVDYEDEAPVTTPLSDEALQDPIPPAKNEENEVSYFPFKIFDDTLFYDSNSKEMEPSNKLEDVEASLPFDEDIRVLEAPAQEEVSKVSYFPFQFFKDYLSYDVESEEVLDFLNPSCYDENDGFVDNINEFIHVGKRKWDVIGYNGDPIYNIEGHFQINKKFSIWQQEHDMIVQTPKDDLILFSPNNFRSYLEDFNDCSSKHLDLFYEENCQPSLCSDLDKMRKLLP